MSDTKAACEIRATWTKTSTETCNNCQAAAPSAACDCPLYSEFGGKCSAQNDARRANPACTAPMDCARACATNDCACVEKCYAANAECKRLVGATDGCVAEVCAPYCK